ncbi:SAM-dependent methyltransferase [Nonomuraea sp. B12E4]|uniref:SAM-dependent methyltransferase n=1 Tax=Nonomuraea sp. B12E4 TaxID=3153564 RepID=UPI00325F60C2
MTRRPPAAQTALGPMAIAAIERHLPPALRYTTQACRWPAVRAWMISASEQRAPGIWGGVLCRKRYADDKVTEAFQAGIRQLVVLGAGLDTRAYRLTPPEARAFELDLSANIADKQRRLRTPDSAVPGQVRLISIDFETRRPGHGAGRARVPARPAGHVRVGGRHPVPDRRRCSRHHGVLVRGRCGQQVAVHLPAQGLPRRGGRVPDFVVKRRVWRFGLAPAEVGTLLAQYGWTEREQVGAEDYRSRYLRPAGRDLPVSDLERFAYAEKQ